MKTTDAELTEKIKSLPPDFSSWIVSYKGENAQVLSGSQDTIHTVHIHRISDTELDVSCSCPAVKLCKHITAFNAVDTIEEAVEAKETLPEPMTGRQMIAEAIEMLVDGIALVIRENNKEDK